MNTNALAPKIAAATLSSTSARGNHREHDVKLHSDAGVAQFTLGQTAIRECLSFLINRENVF